MFGIRHVVSFGMVVGLAVVARADVKLAGVFSDHMVLQRGVEVPVWGSAAPGEKVSVSFGGGEAIATTADDAGKWIVKLPAMTASEDGRVLKVTGNNGVRVEDVLVGDVWLASGQSNMELAMAKGVKDPEGEIAAANVPGVRVLVVSKVVAGKPVGDIAGGKWTLCTPETMRNFSAAAYYFARKVRETEKIPVGIVAAYYGGSNGQSWTRREAFLDDPELKAYITNDRLPVPEGPAVATRPGMSGANSRYRPANFYNGMIAPLEPFALKGFIWYQGEANTGNAKDAVLYAKLFSTMIVDWRKQFAQGELPFYFVQLPTSELAYPDPTDSAWARVRESQEKALAVANTGMIVTLDISEGEIVHAKNKKEVGTRLGELVLNKVYGEKGVGMESPQLKSVDFSGGKAVVTVGPLGDGGLVLKGAAAQECFAIAGEDKVFVWADAVVGEDGKTVIVSSEKVAKPAAVRYAWADNPKVCLFTKEGVVVAPFRTDEWPVVKVTNPRAVP